MTDNNTLVVFQDKEIASIDKLSITEPYDITVRFKDKYINFNICIYLHNIMVIFT